MGIDLSRVRADPLRDYAGVELQQGAVLLDADANEQVAIVDRRMRALASDTLGRATVSATTTAAFRITAAAGALHIDPGRLYVDGLLAENHGADSADPAKRRFDPVLAEPAFVDAIDYNAQPYLPDPPPLPEAGRHLVYLDVWNREVGYLQAPDLVEPALGVPASGRSQTVWQVRVLDENAGRDTTCATADDDVPGWGDLIAPSTGVLTTGTFEVPAVDDPCELPPTGGYRGLENQLYRVEVHNPGQSGAGATFKWSGDNASVAAGVIAVVAPGELELATLGRDDVLRFNTGDWVEIVDEVRELAQLPGEVRIVTVEEATRRISFSPPLPSQMLPASFPAAPVARMWVQRWDQKGLVFRADASGTPVQIQDLDAPGSTGVIAIPGDGSAILLENGVTVSFASTGAKGFRSGDRWQFAARTADASVEALDRAPPRGVHHHYARLGIWDVDADAVTDCRNPWPPAGGADDCGCTVCVTAASHASGTLTVQQAVDQVRERGGTVCLGPGRFPLRDPVRIVSALSVRVRGHGNASVIVAAGAAFVIERSISIAVEDLAIVATGPQSAVIVQTAFALALRRLAIANIATGDEPGAAVGLNGVVTDARLTDCTIVAPIGIRANDASPIPVGDDVPAPPSLVLSATAIADNTFSCTRQAIMLTGTVMHFLMTRICGNQMVGCSEAAITALGLGAPGASLSIVGNGINVPGYGVRVAVGGLRIEGNTVAQAFAGAAPASSSTDGISVVPGLAKAGIGAAQIVANQVSGFPGTGIVVSATVRQLIVKQNAVERCGNGIAATGGAQSSVAIENNQLAHIGPQRGVVSSAVTGIQVTGAAAATIAGNAIRDFAVEAVHATLRAAIVTFAVPHARLNANTVVALAPPGDFVGVCAGILLLAPYDEFDVGHNQSRRDEGLVVDPGNGAFFALRCTQIDAAKPVTRFGTFATIRVDARRLLVLGAGNPFVATLAEGVANAAGAPGPTRGSVLGNALGARGIAPAVEIVASGECLFSDNRVEYRGASAPAAVIVATEVAIMNGNRVRGADISILVGDAKAAALVGNVTTGKIVVGGGPLAAPWDALNLRA